MGSDRTYWIRMEPTRQETLRALAAAAAAAAAVGGVTFYVVRLLLAREPAPAAPPRALRDEEA